ncbi:metallophosphatase [Synergistales bacterium]|nr:metallophosphatase [Synergistales bacterium]
MKKKLWLGVFAALAFITQAFAAPELVIYHTNDVHGYVFHEIGNDGKPTRWGYDYFKALVDADKTPNKLLLDAGDVLHGQAFATARRGELVARVLSMVGYDALAAGNHDYDYGWRRLAELRDEYRLRFVAANVTAKDGGDRVLAPYAIREFPNLKVGVFGLSTPETVTTTDPRNVSELSFGGAADVIEIAHQTVKYLTETEKTDLVIAVTHMGSEAYCEPSSQTIASSVPGIDLIVDGHSHSEIKSGIKIGNTLIVSTGSYFSNVGRVEARKTESGYEFTASLLPASESASLTPNPETAAALNALKAELEQELSVVVMKNPINLNGQRSDVRSGSTNLGRMLAAALVAGTGADVALINGGSIRDSLPAGDVTKGMFLTVMPYGNYVFTVEMTGADILAALNHGLSKPGAGAFPQFYGMTVTARKTTQKLADGTDADSFAADEVKIGGKPLDMGAKYKVATVDFLYSGGDGYTWFGKYAYEEFGTLEDMFRAYLTGADADSIKAVDKTEVLFVK